MNLLAKVLLNTIVAYSTQHPVLKNNPSLDADYADRIKVIGEKYSKKYSVPSNLVFALMKVESDYQLNAVNPRSNDYGIMQVNSYHLGRGPCFTKKKLLSDLDCSIKAGVIVLTDFYGKFPYFESIARYNCGMHPNCPKWKSVRHYVRKVKRYLN